MACRTGCVTRDHESYSACLRAGLPRIAYANSAMGRDLSTQKRWDANLDSYRAARAEGLQPATTKQRDIDAAKRVADVAGHAVNL